MKSQDAPFYNKSLVSYLHNDLSDGQNTLCSISTEIHNIHNQHLNDRQGKDGGQLLLTPRQPTHAYQEKCQIHHSLYKDTMCEGTCQWQEQRFPRMKNISTLWSMKEKDGIPFTQMGLVKLERPKLLSANCSSCVHGEWRTMEALGWVMVRCSSDVPGLFRKRASGKAGQA